jgi:DNA-binding CsgD family transcriptional regulator
VAQTVQLKRSFVSEIFDRQSPARPLATKPIAARQVLSLSPEIAYAPLKIVTQFSVDKVHFYIILLPSRVMTNRVTADQVIADLSGTEYEQQLAEMISRLIYPEIYPEKLAQGQLNRKISVVDSFELVSERYCIAQVIDQVTAQPASSSSAIALSNLLTPREQEIICLIAVGLSNKQIASRIDISIWTVSAHLRRIFAKLKVDTCAAVVYQCSTLIQGWQREHSSD